MLLRERYPVAKKGRGKLPQIGLDFAAIRKPLAEYVLLFEILVGRGNDARWSTEAVQLPLETAFQRPPQDPRRLFAKLLLEGSTALRLG
jgi:hypothetical protein